MKKSGYRFIDLFAGCGGLSLGLEQSGFNPVFVNEINKDALNSYLINREKKFPYLRDPKFHSKDIQECINKRFFEKLKRNLRYKFGSSVVHLVCGGPPCQGFSGMGIRRSYSVDKEKIPSNYLYEDMALFIENMRPEIFLFENVRGILNSKWSKSGRKGEVFEEVFKRFTSIKGYSVKWSLVHAKHFGVPQNRPRVLIVGYRNQILSEKNNCIDAIDANFLPSKKIKAPNLIELLSDLEDKNFIYGGRTDTYPQPAKNRWQKQMRSHGNKIYKKGESITDHEYSNHSKKIRERFKAIIRMKGKIPKKYENKKFAQRVIPKKWDEKGPSITVTSMPDDFIHFNQARSLTVREYARIQTFPDWYQFCGKRTTGGIRRAGDPTKGIHFREVPKYTQIGNAVPVSMAREIGRFFKEKLDQSLAK